MKKELVSVGLIVTGLLTILKVIAIAGVLVTGHPRTNAFLIKQAILAAGFAGTFIGLRQRQKQDRQQRVEALKAKRAGKTKAQEDILPPPAV